jgi:hypothetical protein
MGKNAALVEIGSQVQSRMRWVAGFIAAIAMTAMPQSVAAQARKPLPPSKMTYPLEWAFTTPPPRGTVTPDSACEVAEEYVRQINASRPAMRISELFAEDGIVFQGGGKLLRGRKEIHGFYSTTDAGAGVIPLAFIDNGAECVMEIAIQGYGANQPWRLAGARHFTITPDRRIARLLFFDYGSVPPSTGRQGKPLQQGK